MTKNGANAEEEVWWDGGEAKDSLHEEPSLTPPKLVYDLEERTARFGEAIILFAKRIPYSPVNNRLTDQLVGAGTSIGANYCEADNGVSRKDFMHRIGTCRKEARETKFFLRMIVVSEPSLKPDTTESFGVKLANSTLSSQKYSASVNRPPFRHLSFVIRHSTPILAPALRGDVSDREQPLFGDDFLETLEYLHIVARKILSGQMKAERRSRQKGVSVEFADHRPYTPGDDFRFIDWGVFLRTDNLFLKLFEEEEDLHIYLLLDCSGSMDFGQPYKFHYLRRLAAAIGYLGLAGLDRVFVLPFSQSLPKGAAQSLSIRGKGKVFRLLHFLTGLKASGPTNLAACLKTFAGSRRKRGLAVVLSDCYDESVIGGLNALRYQKFEVFVVHCVSPQEAEPELLGDLRLFDTETGRFREVTLTEALMRRYRLTFSDWCERLEQFCRKGGIGYARCRTDVPFQDTIIHMLRREKFLQ